ncbi:MAG: TetR/AcrR family transcriptional regulator [Thermoleophilaceae bacterium]|nr:TetR/AcrR family transcriptional regulator [Thermoleophilaceae bacterium]
MADRKQDILDAALSGFAEKGLAGTTVEEVRRRSGASVGSIYHHFGDKEGIAAALYVAALRDYQDGFLTVLDDGADAERTVKALVGHHLAWVAEDRDRAHFLLSGRPPRAADGIAELNRRTFRATSEWLAGQVRAGHMQRVPFDVFYAVLIGPAQEFCRHWLEGRLRTSMRGAERTLAAAGVARAGRRLDIPDEGGLRWLRRSRRLGAGDCDGAVAEPGCFTTDAHRAAVGELLAAP